VTTPAASAATPTAQVVTAAAAAKKKPSIRTTVSTRTLRYGAKVKLTAKLINPSNGKAVTSGTVRFQAWRNGRWDNWGGARRLGSSGTATFNAEPHITGYFRAYYLGSGSFTSVAGGKIQVKVVKPVSKGAKVLAEAKRHTGALYKFGAAGPKRFDCSGYTLYVYKKAAGKSLPHKANLQQRSGRSVAKGNKQVGDLIVFRNGSYGSHVGIYAGGGYMYDSPHTGARVGKHKMYGSNYVVRRIAA